MLQFETGLHTRLAAVRRDPRAATASQALEHWLDEHADAFRAWLPPNALVFGCSPDKLDRRLRFLKHLLLHGYLPPRIELNAAPPATDRINVVLLPGYFYPQALSLLEAGASRSDVNVLVAYGDGREAEPWIELLPERGAHVWMALMLDADGLVWRRFTQPVAAHYLLPIDNYFRTKFHLVTACARTGVPLPGSTLIREVCEDKRLLAPAMRDVAGLRLARELVLRANDAWPWPSALERFCAEHDLAALVTKPVDGFGGSGIDFWRWPEDRAALLARLEAVRAAGSDWLVQERLRSVPTLDGREWNIRQYVLRRTATRIEAAWRRVRIGQGVINTTRGAESCTVEQLLANIAPERRAALAQTVQATDQIAAAVLRRLEQYLYEQFHPALQRYVGSGSNLEPDLLALDFIISESGPQQYALYLLEINDFASGGMRDYEVLAQREVWPEAERIAAIHPFSLAPAMLDLAAWRGADYRHARQL